MYLQNMFKAFWRFLTGGPTTKDMSPQSRSVFNAQQARKEGSVRHFEGGWMPMGWY